MVQCWNIGGETIYPLLFRIRQARIPFGTGVSLCSSSSHCSHRLVRSLGITSVVPPLLTALSLIACFFGRIQLIGIYSEMGHTGDFNGVQIARDSNAARANPDMDPLALASPGLARRAARDLFGFREGDDLTS